MEDSWPRQLSTRLQTGGLKVVESRTIAETGWTTADLLCSVESKAYAQPYDLVTLCIGVNNQYRGRPIEEFRAELIKLIHFAKALVASDGGQLVLLSIPDWSITGFAQDRDTHRIATEIDQFNKAMQECANTRQLAFVDWTQRSRSFANSKGAFVEDDLHPSASQYAAWVDLLEKHLGA